MKYTLLLISIIIFFSCSNIKKDKSLLKKSFKTFSFDIGYNTSRIAQGMYEENNEKYFYFFKHLYTKDISVFNEEQQKINSINIKKLSSFDNPIVQVNFLNSDSIILRSKLNLIYLINNKGDLLNTFNPFAQFKNNIDSTYTFLPSIITPKKSIILSTYNDISNPYSTQNYSEYLKYFMKASLSCKRFIVVDNIFTDSLKYEHKIEGLEFQYTDTNHLSVCGHKSYVKDNYLLVYSIYDDHIYQYSLDNFELLKKIKIQSKHSKKLYSSPHLIDENCCENMKGFGLTGDNGMICDIRFNSVDQSYYVSVRKPTEESKEDDLLRYSVIKYNENFELIDESRLFESGGSFMDGKGMFFITQHKNDDDRKKRIYNYYEFN